MKKNRKMWIFQLLIVVLILILANNCNKDDSDRFGTVVISGIDYRTVTIGSQVWMAENLRTTKYVDGSEIPNITDSTEWKNQTTDAYCWYNNDEYYSDPYGALYNYYAVADDRKLCPAGWHLPSDAEWTTLVNNLGGKYSAGSEMKSNELWWWDRNRGANNSSGFNAYPGGYRSITSYEFPKISGDFKYLGYYGRWWSSTEDEFSKVNCYQINGWDSSVEITHSDKRNGLSVRCIMD
jgi:uncharacterized protein (TIGR02145 family)